MTMEVAEWDEIPEEVRLALLEELGYGVEDGVILEEGEPKEDPYVDKELTLENLAVLPGNSPPVLIDNNPVSIACYIEDYGEPA
jgi:hypothetical protein